MPVCKAEAHRALELLEDYYSRLDDVDERELKVAIERVIKIFKSRLFQALLDIQVSLSSNFFAMQQNEFGCLSRDKFFQPALTFEVKARALSLQCFCLRAYFKPYLQILKDWTIINLPGDTYRLILLHCSA